MIDDRSPLTPSFVHWDPDRAEQVWDDLGPVTGYLHGVGRSFFGPEPAAPGDCYRRARVLLHPVSGDVLGVAAAQENPAHPRYLRTHIEIAEPVRRRGLGRAALIRLRELTADDGRAFHSRSLRHSCGYRFVMATGYREIQRCREMLVRPREAYRPSGRYEITTYRVGPGADDHVPAECVHTYVTAFEAAHRSWNPVSASTVEEGRRAFFTTTPALFLSARDLVTGRVAATAFVDPPELGAFDFAGKTSFDGSPVDPADPGGRAVMQDLLLAAADHTLDGEIVVEVDDAYAALVAAVEPAVVKVVRDIVIAATG